MLIFYGIRMLEIKITNIHHALGKLNVTQSKLLSLREKLPSSITDQLLLVSYHFKFRILFQTTHLKLSQFARYKYHRKYIAYLSLSSMGLQSTEYCVRIPQSSTIGKLTLIVLTVLLIHLLSPRFRQQVLPDLVIKYCKNINICSLCVSE